jgi:hypothetical protein
MSAFDDGPWLERVRETLQAYDPVLLRNVAARLCKPRNQWPAQELVERCLGTLGNAAVLDRRLGELEQGSRDLLALLAHSRQSLWRVGNLVEAAYCLGSTNGLDPVVDLLNAGLLFPQLAPAGAARNTGRRASAPRLKEFSQWLAVSGSSPPQVFVAPPVSERAAQHRLTLPPLAAAGESSGSRLRWSQTPTVHEADGLEWPLRLAVLWQMVASSPLRRTQTGGFFKRDLDRLCSDPLLNAKAPDALLELPDSPLPAVELALATGLLEERDGELRAATFPPAWRAGLLETLALLWTALPQLANRTLEAGSAAPAAGNPYPAVYLLSLLLLGQLGDGEWASPGQLAKWFAPRHPFWAGSGRAPAAAEEALEPILHTFLLGLAYELRLVQACRGHDGQWRLRLSDVGRWLLRLGPAPAAAEYARTLLVQPNLEILAYRQGLGPGLLERLSHIAAWKSIGSACTLQLHPETVYRALEAGETCESIIQLLERHGTRPTPDSVLNSLRTWANKRERIQVYANAALFEFASKQDLDQAVARGLPAVRLSEAVAIVASEAAIDFRHFRLTATRDYALPPESCVTAEEDGVTLTIDQTRSDLLVETELQRFADPLGTGGQNGTRSYRVTPAAARRARTQGLTIALLDTWFQQRTGFPLPAASRLLFEAADAGAVQLRRLLVLNAPTPEMVEGLLQWPQTRALIEGRLGPMAVIVAEKNAAVLSERLRELGMQVESET